MTEKPALPTGMFDPFPRIDIDTSDGSPFAQLLRVGLPAADNWTFGPDGPYESPGQTGAQIRASWREYWHALYESAASVTE